MAKHIRQKHQVIVDKYGNNFSSKKKMKSYYGEKDITSVVKRDLTLGRNIWSRNDFLDIPLNIPNVNNVPLSVLNTSSEIKDKEIKEEKVRASLAWEENDRLYYLYECTKCGIKDIGLKRTVIKHAKSCGINKDNIEFLDEQK